MHTDGRNITGQLVKCVQQGESGFNARIYIYIYIKKKETSVNRGTCAGGLMHIFKKKFVLLY